MKQNQQYLESNQKVLHVQRIRKIEIDPEVTEVKELADKDFKTAIINSLSIHIKSEFSKGNENCKKKKRRNF